MTFAFGLVCTSINRLGLTCLEQVAVQLKRERWLQDEARRARCSKCVLVFNPNTLEQHSPRLRGGLPKY